MTLSVGATLPDAELTYLGADGPATVKLSEKLAGKKVVLFALPGAYTGPCSTIHLPSFIKVMDQLKAKGVDEVICIAVNDPFVLTAWGKDTGATEAGITLLGDSSAELTKALGVEFTAPPLGLYDRSNRYALLLDDGVITVAQVDDPGVCDISTGDKFLEALG
ncbi:peroxiredoxin [Actibacterium atlanticum]|uniref:Glutathione-dependent peroxiredoxin n=1 Tax=Actibacterium atlanticum TaxID=1461693 RepID=A0A058ZN78_9RHOB|nr:peroxiredoxin [Actibacterium atlanticum]KCV82226.1 peroxiredoxin [Actibacterium atlanticum]